MLLYWGQTRHVYYTLFAVSAILRLFCLLILRRVPPSSIAGEGIAMRTLSVRGGTGSLDQPILPSMGAEDHHEGLRVHRVHRPESMERTERNAPARLDSGLQSQGVPFPQCQFGSFSRVARAPRHSGWQLRLFTRRRTSPSRLAISRMEGKQLCICDLPGRTGPVSLLA